MLTWRRQHNLWYRHVHNINRVNDKISNSKEEKTSITVSIARMDGGVTESHRETRRQHLHLHLQLLSGQLRNGKRVGAHGSLHHLRNGGDFGFLERIPENRRVRCGQYTHKHCTYSAVQSLHKRGTHRTRLAQELHNIFVPLTRVCHLVRTCLTLCCPSTCLVPRSTSSSLTLPSTTTPEHAPQDNTVYSKNTQYIINLSKSSQSTSGAIMNHSGVRTCRVAEPSKNVLHRLRAQRACDCLKDLEDNRSISVFDAQKEFGERDHRVPITEEVKEFGEIGTHSLPDSRKQRRPTSNRTCTSTIPQKALQILISKMESYKRCWLHHCVPRKLRRNPTHWSCRRERGK